MKKCFFVSDLHGFTDRYKKLFQEITKQRPDAVFLGGDILPIVHAGSITKNYLGHHFISDFLIPEFKKLQKILGKNYPHIFLILGNDDPRNEEKFILAGEKNSLWEYIHNTQITYNQYQIFGYACVPPTPFRLKDWEKYDVSRFVDPGCIPPEEGFCTVPVPAHEKKYSTIQKDLNILAGKNNLKNTIFLFHTPPYQTKLDRAELDDQKIDHVAIDVHVGSIAVKKFIEKRQPLITLHGHVHESARITGSWKDKIGNTYMFSAAHDGPELSLIIFDPTKLQTAQRKLI
jgi:Icc-related predicted phosphoesterase